MEHRFNVEFRVSGEKFDSHNVSLQQIGQFLTNLEQIIGSIVIRDNPELALQEEDVIVSLSSISQGSLVSVLETRYDREVNIAIELTSDALLTENYAYLPTKAIEGLKEIVRFNRKTNSITEIWRNNGERYRLAEITPTTRIRAENFIAKGSTTLYGELLRIGGEDPPRAHIRFIDGTTLSCRIKNKVLASRIAPFLYQRIGVRGVARWDTRDMSLAEFRIEELTPYRQKSIKIAFDNLRELAGQHFDSSEDLAAELRGRDE